MTAIDYDELEKHFGLLRTAPQKYLAMADEFVRENPNHAGGYFHRYYAWEKLGDHQRALDDLETSLRLEPHPTTYRAKGRLLRAMKQYQAAIEALSMSKTMDPKGWIDAYGPLFRADCHAQLGDEAAAIADCALLKDNHFLPYGVFGTPSGNKQEVIAEIRRRAAAARAAQGRA